MPQPVGPSGALARFVADLRLETVAQETQERAKDLILDSIGCAVGADASEELPKIEPFRTLFGTDEATTVIGRSGRTSLGGGTLLNAYRITALTACDVYTPAHFHVTPEVVPPALAVAERDGSTGADFLTAVVAGLEVATRVASGMHYPEMRTRGWHSPGVVGPFGGAAAVGRLRGLDAARLAWAFGLAGSQAAGTWASWGTPAVKFHQARGALSGLLSGLLAETGFPASDEVLTAPDGGLLGTYSDGGDPERISEGLGSRWELLEVSLRPWPGATPVQPVATALMQLVDAGLLPARDPVRVRVSVAPSIIEQHHAFRHPTGTFEAMLSVDFTVAAVIHFGQLGVAEYGPGGYESREVQQLIDTSVEVRADPTLDRLGCRVELESGGTTHQVSVTAPLGHPRNPAPRDKIAAKFRLAAAPSLGPRAADAIVDAVESLADVPDVRELCDLLRPLQARA